MFFLRAWLAAVLPKTSDKLSCGRGGAGMPFAVKTGGHSYAGYCMTAGLMIDMSPMNQAQHSASTRILTLEGGARNAALYSSLKQANAAVTHGRCMSVGAAGFLLGGGIGFNMREHGLGCDQLIETEIVTADGEILTLNARENADLFWACRGAGGGNFGINTSFKLQTFRAQDGVVFAIEWTARAEEVAAALLEALDRAPVRLGSKISVPALTPHDRAQGKDTSVHLLGQLHGSIDELADILRPVYRVAQPTSAKIEQMRYWEAQAFLSEDETPGYYQERSRFLSSPVDAAVLSTAFAHARSFPGTSAGAEFKFFQTGGQINRVTPDETAFVHRRSNWLLSIELNWTPNDSTETLERSLNWHAVFYEAISSMVPGGAYQNFPDPSLGDWEDAYYGANLTRLRMLKAKYDPGFVLRFPQAISPG